MGTRRSDEWRGARGKMAGVTFCNRENEGRGPPVFFVSVADKRVAGAFLVSVASKWV